MNTEPFVLKPEFVSRWVRPIYMEEYNPSRHESTLLEATKLVWGELNDTVIAELLRTPDWRSRSCGAYYATLTCSTSNQPRIEELLRLSDRVYADQSYCYALAAMNTESAIQTLIDYISRMRIQPSGYSHEYEALGALNHLDLLNGTSNATSLLERPTDYEEFKTDFATLMRIREAVTQ